MGRLMPVAFCFRIEGYQWATLKSSEVLYQPSGTSECGYVSTDRLREGSSFLLHLFKVGNFCML